MEVEAERGNAPALTPSGHTSPLNSYKLILLLISSGLGKDTQIAFTKEKSVPKILYLNLYIRYLHVDELKCLSLSPLPILFSLRIQKSLQECQAFLRHKSGSHIKFTMKMPIPQELLV